MEVTLSSTLQTFRALDRHLASLGPEIIMRLTAIDRMAGRHEAAPMAPAPRMDALHRASTVQSVCASNAIEDIHVSADRVEAMFKAETQPCTRDEREVAGYLDVLNLLHAEAHSIPFDPSHIEQLHGYLARYTSDRTAGRWKMLDNRIDEIRPDGSSVVRFIPVSAQRTPAAMAELHDRFTDAAAAGGHHWLMLVGTYVLDFLAVHPFRDGNGRMSRLITTWLLYQGRYDVVRYVSLERLIDQSRVSYYRALAASTVGWHEGEQDLRPWLGYFLGIVEDAYLELDRSTEGLGQKGGKQMVVRKFVAEHRGDWFTIAEVRSAIPGISDQTIKRALADLKAEGSIALEGRGRGAKWRRVSRPGERAP